MDSSSNDETTPQDGDAAIGALLLEWIKTAGPPSLNLTAMGASNQARAATAVSDTPGRGR
jgi:hypothetical protein